MGKKTEIRIVRLITRSGIEYNLGEAAPDAEGRVVSSIEFKRDGVYGLTKGAPGESNYLISLAEEVAGKDVIHDLIPYHETARLRLVKIEEKDDNQSTEISEKMAEV